MGIELVLLICWLLAGFAAAGTAKVAVSIRSRREDRTRPRPEFNWVLIGDWKEDPSMYWTNQEG